VTSEPTQPWRHGEAGGYAALLAAILLFSTIEVGTKLVGDAIPPLRLAFLRFAITGLLLLGPAIRRMRLWREPLRPADLRVLLMLGIVGVTVSIGFYHLSLRYLPANVAAVVFSANPVFVVLFAPAILGERLTAQRIAAVAVGLAGVTVIGCGKASLEPGFVKGLACMLGALISFALYSVLSRRFMPRFGAVVMTSFAGLIGGALLLPWSWAMEGSPLVAMSAPTWLKLLYLSGAATALGYLLFFLGLGRVGASKGSMLFFLKPVLASLCAWLVLGEPVTRSIVVGGAIILAALGMVMWPSAPDSVQAE
jgi:drug/metabolite transporter (DMT)-like permease